MSSGSLSYDWSNTVGHDANNNAYVVGQYYDSIDLDPGPAVLILDTSGYIWGTCIQKFDPLGDLIWAKVISLTQVSAAYVDADSGIIVIGQFHQTVDFDPGIATYYLTGNGNNNLFILKLDPNGDFLWAKMIDVNISGQYFDITCDKEQNIYVTGNFNDSTDFDPGPGTQWGSTINYAVHGFTVKLSSSGDYVWHHIIENVSEARIAADTLGHIYKVGKYDGTVDFDPGSGSVLLTGNEDHFIQCLSPQGNLLWVRSVNSQAIIGDVEVDVNGFVYVAGSFYYSIDFFPLLTGQYTHVSNDLTDCFLLKMAPNGMIVWGQTFGGSGWERASRLDVDELGNVYTIGSISDTVDFDSDTATSALMWNDPGTNADPFIRKVNAQGDFLWVRTMTNYGVLYMKGISVVDNNDIYLTASYTDSIIVNPTVNSSMTYSTGIGDFFTQKYSQCATIQEDTVTVCDSYSWVDGNTYVSSGYYGYTLLDVNGCDSVQALDLTVHHSTFYQDFVSACESYTWIDGNTYTTNTNSATYTLTNGVGCDSVVTLALTIHEPDTIIDPIVACDSITWIDGNTYSNDNNTATYTAINEYGCDSTNVLNLTIGNSSVSTLQVTSCDSYTWIDGMTYTSSNDSATYFATTPIGCDSVIHLDLTIDTVNTGINISGMMLTSQAEAANYQWLMCDSLGYFNLLSGDTNQSYEPTENGNYAIEVSQSGCVDTSECIPVMNVGFGDHSKWQEVSIFPNPTFGGVTIDLGSINGAEVRVLNILGQVVLGPTHVSRSYQKLYINESAGTYFVEVVLPGGSRKFRVLKM